MINWFRRLSATLRGSHWHPETLVCSRHGHVLPAARVASLRPEDLGLGVDLPDGRRLARCLRCDSWREVPVPADPKREYLPPIAQIKLPRRGEALREVIVLRVIALDRIVHVVIFGLLFLVGLLFRLNIGPLHDQAQHILDALNASGADQGSQGVIVSELTKLADVHSRTLTFLMLTAAAYFVLELVEAIGLWHEKRWAEYLTAVATSGLLPLEVVELVRKVTVFRVGALVVNLAIVIWLVYRKRLFGIAGGARSLQHEVEDPAVVLAAPVLRHDLGSGYGVPPGRSVRP